MAKKTKSDVDIITSTFFNLKASYDITIERDYVEEVYVARNKDVYQTYKEIYLTIIKLAEKDYNVLMNMYMQLCFLAKKYNDENWFEYLKLNVFYHSQKSIGQGKINSTSEKKLLIITGNSDCGNCQHLNNTYFDLDTPFDKFPIPLKNCKNDICRALAISYMVKGIERNNYKPL